MLDRPAADVTRIAPLPGFVTPEELLADALPVLDPPSRMSVTVAAERHVRVPVAGVWQAFDRDVTPYTVEPADVTQSRRFTSVVFIGPSQSGKSQMLLNVAMHSVTCEPSPVHVIHMTRPDANAWVDEKLDPAIRNSPALSDLLGKGREDSTLSRKRFRGMRLTVGYPVASQLSSRTQRMVLLTDYDHMPQVLGPKDSPEGSPFGMARQRIRTFMSRGCVLVESSPAFPQEDATWAPSAEEPHVLPPVPLGIVPLYNAGTRGRWYWECPDCAQLFEPRFDRLHWPEGAQPGEAGRRAEMACPGCGSLIAHRHKVELNRRAIRGHGGWRHEGLGGALVEIGDSALRETTTASYALNGAAAAFASWAELVETYEVARRKAELLHDDTDLGQVTYTQIGLPYLPRRLAEDAELGLQFLKDHRAPLARGVCPTWARFVTIGIDVQKGRFVVQAVGWGPHQECAVIDRFDLVQPPEDAPLAGDRALDPARYAEDWTVLLDLADRVWPVEDAGHGLRAMGLAVDYQGQPGVSDRAEEFWRARRRDGTAARWFLSRGWGGMNLRDRVWFEAPERASKGKKARAIKLLNMAVDRLKDSVVASLQRTEDGPGRMHLPEWLDEELLAEFAAEERTAKGWQKRRGVVRNEGLDLAVQCLALAEHRGAHRVDWDAPPVWAIGGPQNRFAAALDAAADDDRAPVAPVEPSRRRRRAGRLF